MSRWNKLLLMGVVYVAFVVPYQLAYEDDMLRWVNTAVNFVFMADLVVHFRTGACAASVGSGLPCVCMCVCVRVRVCVHACV